MAEPFIFINTYRIKEGRADEYAGMCKQVLELAQRNEPDLALFGFFVNEDGTEGTTLQVHRNAENMAYHMELIGDHVEDAREVLDFSSMTIQIYGTPTEPVLEQMRQTAGAGVPVTIQGLSAGFDRLD